MKRQARGILSFLAFMIAGAVLFGIVKAVFIEKDSYKKYRDFFDRDNIDILILGNSHADCGFNTIAMEDDFRATYGREISVFNYAVYGMRMEQMYFFLRELLKTHTPDLICVETFAFCPLADEHREILARRAFDVFPLSMNKIEAIRYCTAEDRWSYYIPFIKYHTRWRELTGDDLAVIWDKSMWSGAGSTENSGVRICLDPGDGWFRQDTGSLDALREPTPTETECLERMIALLEEKHIPLLFVGIPYREQFEFDSIEMLKVNKYLREHYVNGSTVCLLDMNRMWKEMDFGYSDLLDEGHANRSGCEKVTRVLIPWLKEHYDIAGMAG